MKFTTHNEAVIDTNMSHLQGELDISYAELVKTFGIPMVWDDYKTDAEWKVCFEDGTRATIYNYKNGKNYCGAEGQEVQDITDWNIGGFNEKAVERVKEALFRNADIDEYDEGDIVPDHWAIDN
jgi:hypothetical protein